MVLVTVAGAILHLVQDNPIQFRMGNLQGRGSCDERRSFRFTCLDDQEAAVHLGGQYGGVGERQGRGRVDDQSVTGVGQFEITNVYRA